jgi:hypothetical protein
MRIFLITGGTQAERKERYNWISRNLPGGTISKFHNTKEIILVWDQKNFPKIDFDKAKKLVPAQELRFSGSFLEAGICNLPQKVDTVAEQLRQLASSYLTKFLKPNCNVCLVGSFAYPLDIEFTTEQSREATLNYGKMLEAVGIETSSLYKGHIFTLSVKDNIHEIIKKVTKSNFVNSASLLFWASKNDSQSAVYKNLTPDCMQEIIKAAKIF